MAQIDHSENPGKGSTLLSQQKAVLNIPLTVCAAVWGRLAAATTTTKHLWKMFFVVLRVNKPALLACTNVPTAFLMLMLNPHICGVYWFCRQSLSSGPVRQWAITLHYSLHVLKQSSKVGNSYGTADVVFGNNGASLWSRAKLLKLCLTACSCLVARYCFVVFFVLLKLLLSLTDVPSEVDSYHSLFPLEPLPPPNRMQKTSNFSYITSCYKAVNSKDDLPYCLRRIHGKKLLAKEA